MANSHLKLIAPNTVNRTVATPVRKPNAELRTREYLTDAEVESLTAAAKGNRYGHRDATMILVAYRHGLRTGSILQCVSKGARSRAVSASRTTLVGKFVARWI
jgi:site-specific recombinase XerD